MRTHFPGLQNLFKGKKIQNLNKNISLANLQSNITIYPAKKSPEPISQAQHQGLNMMEACEFQNIQSMMEN
jgi:hypothetical protein